MDNLVSFEEIIKLPNQILQDFKEYQEYASLIPKETYEMFDIQKLKMDIRSVFNQYSEKFYLNRLPDYKITSCYEVKENMKVRTYKDQIGEYVEKEINAQRWMTNFYHAILNVAKKLTEKEATFLVEIYFRNNTEENVCEKLGYCRNTLRKIRNSCLVKLWIELEPITKERKVSQ